MAKKSRSRRRTTSRPETPGAETVNSVGSSRLDLATEYHYVVEDLGRVGIIAAVLIGALVVLRFFL